jgi:hypothetical protein
MSAVGAKIIPNKFRVFFTAAGIAVLVLAVGCGTSQFGRLRFDDAVTQMFTTNAVPSEYRYYACGRSNLPYILVGLDPQYQVDSPHWEPLEPNTERFAEQVRFLWTPEIWHKVEPAQGSWIIDPAGRKAGVWYSMYPSAPVVFHTDNRVTIQVPYDEGG